MGFFLLLYAYSALVAACRLLVRKDGRGGGVEGRKSNYLNNIHLGVII